MNEDKTIMDPNGAYAPNATHTVCVCYINLRNCNEFFLHAFTLIVPSKPDGIGTTGIGITV